MFSILVRSEALKIGSGRRARWGERRSHPGTGWRTERNPRGRDEIVATAVRLIDLNYGEPLRVEALAAAVHVSRYYFTKMFTSVMGRSPSDYIRHVRLERARALLSTTSMSVSEIARITGFGDHAQFSRMFRAVTAESPRSFRRRAQA